VRCSVCGKDLKDSRSCSTLIGLACDRCLPRGDLVSFLVRPAKGPADEAFVLEFLEGLFGETEFIEFGRWYRVEEMEKLIAEGEHGTRFGFAVYCPEEDGMVMTLLTINVHERYMRRGVASALLDELEKIAVESGVARIRVPISNDDLLSYVFYHRKGFRLSGLDLGLCVKRHGKEESGFWKLPLRDEFYLSRDTGGNSPE
jgi:GNAT superfamily N-acetyltransferase